jgi:sugar/nucleoside kinase (ribokinase family)
MTRDAHPADGFAFDVVGVGALNLDYIAASSAVQAESGGASFTERVSRILGHDAGPVEWGTEKSVDADTIYAALEAVEAKSLKVTLGGSAFNAVCAVAHTELGLRIGYVGVSGRMPLPGFSAVREMDRLGIDHSGVQKRNDVLCGVCFSYVESGERTLLTHAGANEGMADYLREQFDTVVAYLASAKVVHVTSFLDEYTPACLLAVLKDVRRQNPQTLISFDPGHVWCTSSMAEMDGLLELADFVLVNNQEFRALGGYRRAESDDAVATKILARIRRDGYVILKKPTGITAMTMRPSGLRSHHYAQAILPDSAIEDATGAGDVFAAGMLAVITSDRLQIEAGALLGMELARHKLRFVGHGGHAQFPQVVRDFIRSLDPGHRWEAEPSGVFIAHGGAADWLAVKELVEAELNLRAHYFERQTWGSIAVTEAIAANLERCSFAICVLTAEDLTAEGKRLARQNVVHEIGLFQGRYGFDRVVVLAEEGCDYVPSLALPYCITFAHNGIRSTFWRVRTMIKDLRLRPRAGR